MNKSIGFVTNLEEHFPLDWWTTYFNEFYLQTDGDVLDNPDNTLREVNLLIEVAHLKPENKILDLCCGQGRHCIELARQGFQNISGIDYSEYLINLARQRANNEKLSINFGQQDIRNSIPENFYDCITMLGNSFGYFDNEKDDIDVINTIAKSLRPEGKLVMHFLDAYWVKKHFHHQTWEWINQDSLVCRERALSADKTRLLSRVMIFHQEKGLINERFIAYRLYTKEHIQEILEKVGFKSIHYYNPAALTSDRHQDLGMMSHLMLLTASTQ